VKQKLIEKTTGRTHDDDTSLYTFFIMSLN